MDQPALPNLSTRELMAVVAVAEYGSFVAASAFLKTSQPAVTRALKHVEKTLGVTLFARTTRRVEITPAGREFVAIAERLLADLQLAVRNMRDVSGEQRGQIIVSTYSAFACQPLPPILATYRETRPQIDVRLREGRQPDIIEDVRSGVADFGVGFVDTLPDTLDRTMLRREPLYVMIPAGHPMAAKRPRGVALAALRKATLIALPGDSYTRRLVDGAAATAGFALRYSTIVTRFESVVHYVRAGAGLGIVPEGALPPKPADDVYVAPLLAPSLSVTLGIITRRAHYLTPAASGLIALIAEALMSRKGGRRPGRASSR
jgi:DNA-binding transcriptional LysR family regulator